MFFSLLVFFATAWGQVGSTTDALGGASLGNNHPLDSAWTNPAGLAGVHGVYAGLNYFKGDVSETPESDLKQYGATITDGSGSTLPGSIGYRQRTYEVGANRVNEKIYRLAAAVPLNSRWALGVAGYRVHTEPWNAGDTNQDNVDLSVLWNPWDGLQFGAITRGVFGSKDGVYGPSHVEPSGGVGMRLNLMRAMSLLTDLNYGYEGSGYSGRLQTQVGLELATANAVALRLGFNNDDWHDQRRICAGLGWDGPKLRVGYAYQKETRQKLGESHTVDIWLAF